MSALHVPRLAVPTAVSLAFFGAYAVSTWFPIPSFDWVTEGVEAPPSAETVELRVKGLKCRHSSEQMHSLLFGREDARAPRGYLRAVIYPSPGVGKMYLTYDPEKTDLQKIAQAVKLDSDGLESEFRILLDVEPDLSSPKSVLAEIAKSFDSQHEELFLACHVDGAASGVDFAALVAAWGDLFFEGLAPLGEPAADGTVRLAGISVGDTIPVADFGVAMTSLRLTKTAKGWKVAAADWGKFRSE